MSLKHEYASDESELDRFAAGESAEPPLTRPFPSEQFRTEYEFAYDAIFAALIPFGCTESGGSQRGALRMSRYVDPTRHLTVVVREYTANLPEAIHAVHGVLQSLPESYSVRFDDYPTVVCVSRSGRVLGYHAHARYECLLPYGFPNRIA